MNKEQLDAIKGRVANATPGEWIIDNSSDDRPYITDIWFDGEENGHVEIHRYGASAESYDAKFIAHARQDVPALIAEVERLQKALKNTDADLYVYKDLYNEMTDKSIELIKFLQARITKGWGQKAIDLAMIHIQEQEKDIERLQQFERKAIYTMEENARLREDYEATEDLFRRTNEELGYEQEENKRLRDENKKLQKAMIEIKHSNINSNPNQQLDNLHAYCIAVATKALEDEECS